MTTPREHFLRQKELVKWWVSIVSDPRFDDVTLHARSEFAVMEPSSAELHGAHGMLAMLHSLAEAEEQPASFPTPGLHHDLDDIGKL